MAMAAASATAATYGTTVALAVLVALAMCLPAGEAANSLAINVDGKIMYGASDVDDGSGFSYLDVGMDPNAEVRPSLNVAVAAALSDTERRLTLRSDIGDFLDLIPGEEVRQRVDDHYRSDADVQTALTYIAGKEFVALLHEVREVQDFQRWLTHAGVNIKEVLQRLANLVGLSKLGRAGVLVVPTATAATAAVNQSAGGGLLSGTGKAARWGAVGDRQHQNTRLTMHASDGGKCVHELFPGKLLRAHVVGCIFFQFSKRFAGSCNIHLRVCAPLPDVLFMQIHASRFMLLGVFFVCCFIFRTHTRSG